MYLYILIFILINLVFEVAILIIVLNNCRYKSLHYTSHLVTEKVRILRDFKNIYYSYVIYSTCSMNDNFSLTQKLNKLLKNSFLGNEISVKQEMIKSKINKLEILSDDFSIYYTEEEMLLVQDFIFWYKMILKELFVYKKSISLQEKISEEWFMRFEKIVKNLDACYTEIKGQSILEKLCEQCKLS